jgi:hypothetical protein
MKNSRKQRKQANLAYKVYVHVSDFGASQEDATHFSFEHEFSDLNPLVARQNAFAAPAGVEEALLILTDHGFLNLASPAQAEQRGWKNFTRYSYTITLKVTDNKGSLIYEEPLNNDEGQEVAINGLTDEYAFYNDYGYETGETMELEDGEIVLLTDPWHIYD